MAELESGPESSTSALSSARKHRVGLSALAILWLAALVPGVRYLLAYEHTPGRQAAAPEHWPEQVALPTRPGLPTLVIALHPRCSCSRATLAELEQAAPEFKGPYNAILLIDQPRGANYQWRNVSFYREAQQALEAQVVLDDDGHLAAAFGALTSGDVRLYSSASTASQRLLLFAGGVTGSRGMVGPNGGIDALKLAFRNPVPDAQRRSPVFGCALASSIPNLPPVGP